MVLVRTRLGLPVVFESPQLSWGLGYWSFRPVRAFPGKANTRYLPQNFIQNSRSAGQIDLPMVPNSWQTAPQCLDLEQR